MVTHGNVVTALPRVHSAALDHFGRLLRDVEPEQWALPTPCRQWTVRDLVNHVTVQEQWLALLLSGASVADVGDRLDGDQLGDDPVLAFKRASAEADETVRASGALEGTVELWQGPAPAHHLASQLAMDLVVHSWDLARGTGADDHLPAPLVAFALRELSAYADRLAGTGLFDPALTVPGGADSQTRLLALTGRQAGKPGGAPPTDAETEPAR
jgi:uncharacterized protein (TIGR03086 family)